VTSLSLRPDCVRRRWSAKTPPNGARRTEPDWSATLGFKSTAGRRRTHWINRCPIFILFSVRQEKGDPPTPGWRQIAVKRAGGMPRLAFHAYFHTLPDGSVCDTFSQREGMRQRSMPSEWEKFPLTFLPLSKVDS